LARAKKNSGDIKNSPNSDMNLGEMPIQFAGRALYFTDPVSDGNHL
jgi:hypothetical protein